MRVKVRFNAEACQAPIVIDLRFLPRIGERLEIGFRKVIEVEDVRRVDNDSRISGIIRGRFIYERRNAPAPPPPPMPIMPMPPISIPVAAPVEKRVVEETPAEPKALEPQAAATGALYGNLNFDELAATVKIPNIVFDPPL